MTPPAGPRSARGAAGAEELNALTVDVEEYFQVTAFAGAVRRDAWDVYPSRVETSMRLLFDTFDDAGVKATFFFLGWIARRYPALVREAVDGGHEIACHGWDHRLVHRMTRDEFREDLRRAVDATQQAGGAPVRGYRAPSFSVNRESLWAFDVLAELGFLFDSSVYPVRHDIYGMAGWERGLHYVADGRLVEAPLTTVRIGPVVLPCAGGGYFRLYPYALTRAAIRHVNRREGRAAIVYLHPWEFDPDQPRLEGPRLSRFRHYTGLRRSRSRLKRLLSDFRFSTLGEVVNSWSTSRAVS